MSFTEAKVEYRSNEEFQQVPDRDFYLVKMRQEALWALNGKKEIKQGRKTDVIPYTFEDAEGQIRILSSYLGISQTTRLNHLADFAEIEYEGRIARNRIVLNNLELMYKIVNRFGAIGVPLEDLEQVGILALYRAADLFDPSKNTAFSTFAAIAIHRNISRYINRNKYAINLPNDFSSASCNDPEAVWVKESISLDLLFERLGGENLIPSSIDTAMIAVERIEIEYLYEIFEKVLTAKEAMIIKLSVMGYSSEEIGKKFKLTVSRINQIKQIANNKILSNADIQEIVHGMLNNPFR